MDQTAARETLAEQLTRRIRHIARQQANLEVERRLLTELRIQIDASPIPATALIARRAKAEAGSN